MPLLDQIANLSGNIQNDRIQSEQHSQNMRMGNLNEQFKQLQIGQIQNKMQTDDAYGKWLSGADMSKPISELVKQAAPFGADKVKQITDVVTMIDKADKSERAKIASELQHENNMLANMLSHPDGQRMWAARQVQAGLPVNPQTWQQDIKLELLENKKIHELATFKSGKGQKIIETNKGYAVADTSGSINPLMSGGEQVQSGASARSQAIDARHERSASQADERIEIAREREATRREGLKLRQDKHVDKLIGEFSDDFRNDTKSLKSMSEGIESSISILNKPIDDFSPADAKLLQRTLASIARGTTKAQSEIFDWDAGGAGNVLERLWSTAHKFAAGTPAPGEIQLYRDSLNELMDNYVNPAYQRYGTHYEMKAAKKNLDKEDIIPERFEGPSEDWINKAMELNSISREEAIREGIKRGKLKEGLK